MNKVQIRNEMRKKRKELKLEDMEASSRKIALKLYEQPSYQNATAIYSYVSYNQEIDTIPIITHSLSIGKKVAVPKVLGSKIEFFFIKNTEELEVGYQGILEPPISQKADGTSGLMLLPGLAFDYQCNRIGYGGGFYDKYLEHSGRNLYKIALGYEFQVVRELQTEEFDKKVDCILTPHLVLKRENYIE